MNKNLQLWKAIEIDADAERVWDTLTNPEKNRQFFDGTEILTDWKVGSPIVFQGEFQGRQHIEKGTVRRIEQGKILQYDYWTVFSGLEDSPENYSMVTYTLDPSKGHTRLTVTRVGFANDREYQYSQIGWEGVLKRIKEITEQG